MRQRRLGREPGARHPQPRLRRFGIGAPDPIESGDRGAEIAVGQRRSGGVDRRSRTVIAGQADASDRDQPASPIERLLPPCRRRRRRARRAGELAGEIIEPAAQCRAARHRVARGVGQRRCPGGQRRIAAGEPAEGAVRRLEGLAVHDRLTHLLHRQQQGGTGAIGHALRADLPLQRRQPVAEIGGGDAEPLQLLLLLAGLGGFAGGLRFERGDPPGQLLQCRRVGRDRGLVRVIRGEHRRQPVEPLRLRRLGRPDRIDIRGGRRRPCFERSHPIGERGRPIGERSHPRIERADPGIECCINRGRRRAFRSPRQQRRHRGRPERRQRHPGDNQRQPQCGLPTAGRGGAAPRAGVAAPGPLADAPRRLSWPGSAAPDPFWPGRRGRDPEDRRRCVLRTSAGDLPVRRLFGEQTAERLEQGRLIGLPQSAARPRACSRARASAAALIDRARSPRSAPPDPAPFASRTKIAAVRGEKNKAKSIMPEPIASTAAGLSAATGRAA